MKEHNKEKAHSKKEPHTKEVKEESLDIINQESTGMPGPWELVKEYAMAWKERWSLFAKFNVVIGIAILLTFLVFGGLFAGSLLLVDAPLNSGDKVFEEWLLNGGSMGTFALGIVLFVVMIAANILIGAIASIGNLTLWKNRDEEPGVMDLIKKSWPFVSRYIWVSILAAGAMALGYFFFIIPGIVLAFSFALLVPIIFAEELRGKEVLFKARALTRGKLGAFAWRLIVAFIILFIPVFILSAFLKDIGDFIGNIYALLFAAPVGMGILWRLYNELTERYVEQEGDDKIDTLFKVSLIGGGVIAALILVAVIL